MRGEGPPNLITARNNKPNKHGDSLAVMMGARHTFRLLPRPSCPSTSSGQDVLLHLSQGDISEWRGDVVVSAANSSLEGSSRLKSWWGFAGKKNVEQALHVKAGPWLQHNCNGRKVVRYAEKNHKLVGRKKKMRRGVDKLSRSRLWRPVKRKKRR